MKEALLNLVTNAVAHTPPGGVVTVLHAHDPLGCSLGVTDNGPGLSPQQRDTLGDRFSRHRDPATRGSGLGPIRESYGVYPFALTGQPLEDFVQEQIKTYAVLASELGLRVRP